MNAPKVCYWSININFRLVILRVIISIRNFDQYGQVYTNLRNFRQVLAILKRFNIPFCSFDAGLILLTIKLILSQTLVPWTLTFIVPIQTIQESITNFPVWNTMSRTSGTFQWSLRTSTAQAVTLILIRTVHAVNDAITSVDHVDAHKDLKLKNFIYQALHIMSWK